MHIFELVCILLSQTCEANFFFILFFMVAGGITQKVMNRFAQTKLPEVLRLVACPNTALNHPSPSAFLHIL